MIDLLRIENPADIFCARSNLISYKAKNIRKTLQMVLHEICSIGGEPNELF